MLTDAEIQKAVATGRTYRLYDAKGLYLEVSPEGHKWWRLKYRFQDKEKRISLGVYPEASLEDARSRCTEARKFLFHNLNPSDYRKAKRAAGSKSFFEIRL